MLYIIPRHPVTMLEIKPIIVSPFDHNACNMCVFFSFKLHSTSRVYNNPHFKAFKNLAFVYI